MTFFTVAASPELPQTIRRTALVSAESIDRVDGDVIEAPVTVFIRGEVKGVAMIGKREAPLVFA